MKLIFSLLLIATIAYANNTAQLMQQALNSLVQLLPLSSSEMKFTDPQFEKEIKKHLVDLESNFLAAKHSKELHRNTLEPSYETILEQIEEAKISFNSDNKYMARMKINQIGYLCLSCHTQFPKDKLKTQITNHKLIDKVFKTDAFNRGNIQFILRDYQDALKSYEKVIAKRIILNNIKSKSDDSLLPQKQLFDKRLYQSIFNSVLIYTKIQNAPNKAQEFINKLDSQYRLPKYLISEINKWNKQLNFWQKGVNLKKKIKSMHQESVLDGSHDIDLMMVSGELARNYYSSPRKTKEGEVLFWLAMAEFRFGKNMFFSLGDIYLKQCIHHYQKTKMAKKCYDAYEEEIIFRNTGSSGVFLPEATKKELDTLKALL